MLNAVKAFLAFKCEYIEDFVEDFAQHGLFESKDLDGDNLSSIAVGRKKNGVFSLFGKTIDKNFESEWKNGKSEAVTLKKLLYNLAFIHRAFIITYKTPRAANIPELFLPLVAGKSPCYHKANDSKLYLMFEIDKNFFSSNSTSIPQAYSTTMSDNFQITENSAFVIRSKIGAKRNTSDSLSTEFKELNNLLRPSFQYIRSNKRLWYLKREKLSDDNIININSMLITLGAMHRISEIVRYKPEQLAHLINSKENWLLHEFITLALDQFIDELATEITGQDIMGTGMKI